MKAKTHKPAWWILYVLLIGMLGLILLESQDGASTSAHMIIDGLIVVAFFGGVLGWVHFNETALERAEMENVSLSEYHVIEYEPKQPSSAQTNSKENRSTVKDDDYILLPLREN